MPNWCENAFRMAGPKDKIKAIWDKAQAATEANFLNTLVPIGEWDYGRAVEAWGTKWDIDVGNLDYDEVGDDEAEIRGWFESAWSPPVQALMTYCAENEDVRCSLEYFEPGVGFIGRWNSHDNVDECYEIDPSDLDSLPQDLREGFNVDDWYDLDEEAA